MSKPLATLALALLVASPLAQSAERDVRDAARANGLTLREQRMLSGAPTAYAEYRTSYWQARDKRRRLELAAARGEKLDERPARVRRVEVEPVYEIEREVEPVDEAETYALPDT